MENSLDQCAREKASASLHTTGRPQLWSLKLECEKDACTIAFVSLNPPGSVARVYLKLKKPDQRSARSTLMN